MFSPDQIDDTTSAPASRHITPLDLRQTTFPTAWRGYAPSAVRSFLMEASDGFEQAMRENERLRQEITRLEGVIRQHRELEATLNSTLIQAQRVSDDMRANAKAEAERVVREAKGRAELLIAAAQTRVDDAQRDIDGLRLRRRDAEIGLESLLSSLQSTLDFVREQNRDSKVLAHRPRIEAAAS